jgi:hypothetical protein
MFHWLFLARGREILDSIGGNKYGRNQPHRKILQNDTAVPLALEAQILWGRASTANIEIPERFQSKVEAPLYLPNTVI